MIVTLLIAIYLLNVIDYCQTIYAVRFFGIGVEYNPIARLMIINNCGWICKLIIFPAILSILGAIVHFVRYQIWVLYVLLTFFSYIVIHNFIILSRLGLFKYSEEQIMTTVMIVCTVITAVSAIACGALCAYYKHLKKK